MDVFDFREHLVGEYEQFTRSFLQRAMVRDAIFLLIMGIVVSGGLWVVLGVGAFVRLRWGRRD